MLGDEWMTILVTGIALAAVPCAISAVMHSVIGSIFAGVWRMRDKPVTTTVDAQP